MGMLRFDGSGHFPFICNGHVGHSLFWASFLFIQTGMLRFGCSGHPFLSFKRACCVLAVLGIFSLHEVGHVAFGHFGAFFLSCKWACRILVVLAMLSFHWSETLGGGSVSNSSGAPWVLIHWRPLRQNINSEIQELKPDVIVERYFDAKYYHYGPEDIYGLCDYYVNAENLAESDNVVTLNSIDSWHRDWWIPGQCKSEWQLPRAREDSSWVGSGH